jgi:hypothetical protein
MSLPLRIPPAYAAAQYEPFAPNYYNTPYARGFSRALQSIQCVGYADLVDTDYFALTTVVDGATSFEFDVGNNGVVGGRVEVSPPGGYVGTETPAQVAALVQTAIEGAGLALIVAQAGDGLLLIRHAVAGETYPGSDHVADAGFVITDLSLGSDGDGWVPVRWGLSRAFVADGRIFS